jgi:hypothetical protein
MFQFDYCVNENCFLYIKNPYGAAGLPALPGLEINFVSKRISDLSKTAVPISR